MSDDYGSDFIQITDEDGEEFELEHLDTVEIDGVTYMAFLPAGISQESDDYGIVILRVVEVDGEDMLETIEDDDLREAVYEAFIELLFEEEDDEAGSTPIQ